MVLQCKAQPLPLSFGTALVSEDGPATLVAGGAAAGAIDGTACCLVGAGFLLALEGPGGAGGSLLVNGLSPLAAATAAKVG